MRTVSIRASRRRLTSAIQHLEPRRCLAAYGYAQHTVDVFATALPADSSMITADFDGDNDLDLFYRGSWRANDGTGAFGSSRPVFTGQTVHRNLAADIDSDGDMDVVISGVANNVRTVAWFENLDGKGYFGPARIVAEFPDQLRGSALVAGDLDNDGDVDLVEAVGRLTMFENVDGRGRFAISSTMDPPNYGGAIIEDVDQDGDADIVSSFADSIVLLENVHGEFSQKRLLDIRGRFIIHDVDLDGKLDFLVAQRYSIEHYDFDATSKELTHRKTIRSLGEATFSRIGNIAVGDVDGDDDLDLAAVVTIDSPTSGHTIEAFHLGEAGYGGSRFIAQRVAPDAGSSALCFCDVDGNGTDDLIADSAVHHFDVASQRYQAPQYFAEPYDRVTTASVLADMDGDGDLDSVAADSTDACFGGYGGPCDVAIFWRENTDGAGTFSARRNIAVRTERREVQIELLVVNDIDGDGDLDIVFGGDGIPAQWIESRGGPDAFGDLADLVGGNLLGIADADGDGRVDPVTHEDGFFTLTFNATDFENRESVQFASRRPLEKPLLDFDLDGDLDVLAANSEGIVWYENRANRDFAPSKFVFSERLGRGSEFVDLDSDGDVDFVSRMRQDGTDDVVWRENLGSDGTEIRWGDFETLVERASLHGIVDIDLDGAGDLRATRRDDRSGPVVFLNDGKAGFRTEPVPVPFYSIAWGDIDGDGDADTIGADGLWHELRLVGDANGDGIFSSADLVLVMLAREYDDWFDRNSTFKTGDWNGDFEFDSADLVFASKFGHYSG